MLGLRGSVVVDLQCAGMLQMNSIWVEKTDGVSFSPAVLNVLIFQSEFRVFGQCILVLSNQIVAGYLIHKNPFVCPLLYFKLI